MEVLSCCPKCGYDKAYDENMKQTAIRKCRKCNRIHCSKCPEVKNMTSYVCPFCGSNDIGPYACIRNPR